MTHARAWTVCLIAVTVAVVGCASAVRTGSADLVSGDREFGSSSQRTRVGGYVYVPTTDPGAALSVSAVVFAAASTAPAGTVPATGVNVSASVSSRAGATQTTTDASGYFLIDITDTGGDLLLVLDFSAAQPEWTQVGLGVISGDVGSDTVLTAGLVTATRDMSTISNASAVRSVESFSAEVVASNASDGLATLDVWLSATGALDAASLYDAAGAPISADNGTHTYHVWQSQLPAGATALSVAIPWEEIRNGQEACELLNPNSGRDGDGRKLVTLYCTARPTGEGLTLSRITAELTVVVSAGKVGSSGTVPTRLLTFDLIE